MDQQQILRDCRLANRLQEQLRAGQVEALDRLIWRVACTVDAYRQLDKLHQKLECWRNQPAGVRVISGRIRRFLPSLVDQIQLLQRTLESPATTIPTCLELAGELQQLRQEFGGYEYSHSDRSLTVQTESIELQDQYLGPFSIRLQLAAVGQLEPRRPYRVIAEDPHPARGDDGVTHPHISDEHLCEGDATLAIRGALRTGRLADFYLLVSNVLNTYNPGSAYVALNQWTGRSCSDCGHLYPEDEESICDRCECSFCSECTNVCPECDRTVCGSCSLGCEGCSTSVCIRCAHECTECEGHFCQSCITDGLCNKCKEARAEKEEHHETQPAV